MSEKGQNESKIQQPGEVIKPFVPESEVTNLVWKLYGFRVNHWTELNSYDDRNYHVIVDSQPDNPYIPEVSGNGYVLKVLNSMDSKRPAIIEAQHALLEHVRKRGIKTQEVMKNKYGQTMSLEKINPNESQQEESKFGSYIVRLLSYIPGEIFHAMPYVPQTFYNTGKFVGEMHQAMQDFHHDFYDSFVTLWSLEQIEKVSDFVFVVKNPEDKRVVSEVIEAFAKEVKPNYNMFTKGIIHGDINEQNLILTELPNQSSVAKEERACEISGILDFSDVTYSYLLFDIAITICYLSIECKLIDQLDVGGHVLAGYLTERSLNNAEREALKICICARLVQSLVMGTYTNYMDPSNTYVLTTSALGWPLLRKLWKCPQNQLYERWDTIIKGYANL